MILSLKKDLSSLSFSYSKAGLSFSDSRCQDQIPKASQIRVNQVENPLLEEGEVEDVSENEKPIPASFSVPQGAFSP